MIMIHKIPELPYSLDSLAPTLSRETLEYHYGKHLQGYLDNTNQLIKGTRYEEMTLKDIIKEADGLIFNNAAQAWNHILYFKQLTPTPVPMSSNLTQAIIAQFGSIENFRKKFTESATKLFGSGWVWVALDAQHQLQIVSTSNAGNPITQNMRPLLCVDVWEHAYYIDYRNRRPEYIEKFWSLINWNYVEHRMEREDSMLYY